jgi:uncharacterized tellurite resistance protein B-like protein
MAELPPLPDDWTDGASAAYLLLGVAIIDGVLHDEETEGVYQRLQRHVDEDPQALHDSVDRAWDYLQSVFQVGGIDSYLDSLESHCYALRGVYPKATLQGLVEDLVEVAQSDGDVASAEIAYIAAVSGHLGVTLNPPGHRRDRDRPPEDAG